MAGGPSGGWFPADVGAGSAGCMLFCFPHGGGGAEQFRRWKADMPPHIELVPVLMPGRESRFAEPLLTSVAAVVAAIVEPLTACARRPFALFGHSMGALLAYETAAALADRGLPPSHLIVSGHHPPHLPSRAPVLHDSADQEFAERLAEMGGMPADLLRNPEMMDFLLPRFRADFEICETYRYAPRPPIPVPVTVLAGREDPAVDVSELGRWGELTTEGADVHVLDGGHFWNTGPQEAGVRALVVSSLEGAGRV
ncbi:thioesterase II family protein [Amycolatopsis sp. MtRt-6]|uniref:thioesterase II family protein n=1 Tax=Amycolatopsis sp. MtRt-6 TaxID=2792782 RepID=UPI001A8EBE99|nr:alpha/beta fold hydrolase [Amycolatopsis sp. MtRt-6]